MEKETKLSGSKIKPEKITKPIQLLAVWLTALIILETAYITASVTIKNPEWLSSLFAISAVIFVPLFLVFVFLLQTRFRVEIQEDPYFLEYKLNQMTGEKKENDLIHSNIKESFGKITSEILSINSETQKQFEKLIEHLDKNDRQIINHDNLSIIKERLKSTDIKIKKLKESVEWSEMIIKVNYSLERYEDIIKALKENSIEITGTFGREDTDEKETIFLLSFGRSIDYRHIIFIIKTLLPFGLKYIQCISEEFGAQYEKGIYIGAFTYRDKNEITEIDNEIINKIDSIESKEKFLSLINAKSKILYL